MGGAMTPYLVNINAMTGGLFLLAAFAIIATRQMSACLRWFIIQSILLSVSAAVIGLGLGTVHLAAVALITLVTKVLITPWLLRRTVRRELYGRREISQVFNIPTSLLIAAALTLLAYAVIYPVTALGVGAFTAINLPIGLAGLFLGAYTVAVRREALAQLIGLLGMENGAFLAGISIAYDQPMISELAAAFDVLVMALVIGLLVRRIDDRVGGTSVGRLDTLRER